MPDAEARAALLDALRETLKRDQLADVAREILGVRLDDEVHESAPYRTVVADFVAHVEEQDDQMRGFLVRLSLWPQCPARLRRAIYRYLGVAVPGGDPYQELLPSGQPFVNRRVFRDVLARFIQEDAPLLLVEGPPKHGRTFSTELLYHVGQAEGVRFIPVDLRVYGDVLEPYEEVVLELGAEPVHGRDGKAQAPALGRGLVSILRRTGRALTVGKRWCLVFDHYDDVAVDPTFRQFVDTVAQGVLAPSIPGVSVVVLGNASALFSTVKHRGLRDEVGRIVRQDVERFLSAWAEERGRDSSPAAVAAACDEVLDGLESPLTPTCLPTLQDNLRAYVTRT